MEYPGVWKLWVLGPLALLVVVVVAGCAERRPPAKVADPPERHAESGMSLLERGDLDAAQAEFDQALALDAQWGPAYAGEGLILGIKARRSRDAGEKGRLTRQAFDHLRKAKKYAVGADQKIEAYVAFIRVQTMIGEAGWLEDGEENFRFAVAVDGRAAAPYFFMGEAYKKAYRFGDAARMYRKVSALGGDYKTEADRALTLMERIQQADPGTTMGKQVALANVLTRGEAAALFVQELKVEDICARAAGRNAGPSPASSAAAQQTEPAAKLPAAVDIGAYPLRSDVEAILPLGVRGLELYPDQTFRPGELVTRAAFAVMMAAILAKARGEERQVASFSGMSSPFVDVSNDLPYFGAVMTCTSFGIMKSADTGGREFRPTEPVSGIEALLAVRTLKGYVKTD